MAGDKGVNLMVLVYKLSGRSSKKQKGDLR